MVTYDYERLEMLPFVPDGTGRLLDVGCDTGRFGDLLRARFPDAEIWGIDPSPPDREHSFDQRITGLFPDALPACPPFDCIVFNDVLEHTADPWAVLADTRRLLSSTGRVVASIPNVRHRSVLRPLVLHGQWQYEEQGVLDRTHLRFFTRASMIDLFHDSGFEVLEIQPINVDVYGKLARVNRLLQGRLTEVVALQYALVARPV
jgi:2-polyprenyl-3-methyl-5-hydroxy-6-metoxy-1,4-benzoquinol methylase